LVESFWTCTKRWKLERLLEQRGHRWPKASQTRYAPLCGAECVGRILAWLDTCDDPHGTLPGTEPREDVELAAGWEGKPGLLWDALVGAGWVVQAAGAWRWHDYAALNGFVIQARNRKRRERDGMRDVSRDGERDEQRDQPRDGVRDGERDMSRSSSRTGIGSGSGTGSGTGSGEGPGDLPPSPPSGGAAPAAPERPAARAAPSPQEALARDLASRLGSSLRPCQAQVRALRAEGWDLERIRAAVEEHATAGIAPWDWTKLAKGTAAPSRHGGLTGDQIREQMQRPPSGAYAAFHGGGGA
jgi:hypothetical protein